MHRPFVAYRSGTLDLAQNSQRPDTCDAHVNTSLTAFHFCTIRYGARNVGYGESVASHSSYHSSHVIARRPFLASTILLLALGGCAGVPSPPDAKVELPSQWRHADALATDAPKPDLHDWWRTFGDAGLDRLVDAALAQNLGVAEATYRLRAARARAGQTEKRFLPSLGARTLSAPNVESTASYFQTGFDALWEIGWFGRHDSETSLSGAGTGAAQTELAAAQVSVVAEVVRTYVELRAAQALHALATRTADLDRALVAQLERRVALQLAASVDVEKARQTLVLDEARAAARAQAIDQAATALARLLGRTDIDPSWLDNGAMLVAPASIAIAAPADLLRTRPEIRRAEWEVQKAAAELGIARADMYPQLTLGGTLTYASKIDGDKLLDSQKIFSLGPLLNVPLFDWGMRRAAMVAHGELLSAAVTAYRQSVIEGVAEVENALGALAASRTHLDAVNAAFDAGRRQATQTARLRELGLADALDAGTVTAAVVQAEAERVEAQAATALAVVALYKSLGGAPLPMEQPPS